MEEFKQADTLMIRDLDTLKVVADPLRTQIVDLVKSQPLTVKEIASKLGLSAGKLYYHINILEKHSLIRVVETRQISNLIEKLYLATAEKLDVDPSLLSSTTAEGQENILSLITSTLDTTREDVLRSMQARFFELNQGAEPRPRRAIVDRIVSRIPEKRVEEFTERIMALVTEFEKANIEGSAEGVEIHPYALTVLIYPSFYFPDDRLEGA